MTALLGLLLAGPADALEITIPLLDEPVELQAGADGSNAGLRLPFASSVRFASVQSIVLTLTGDLVCPGSACSGSIGLSVRLDSSGSGAGFGRVDFVWDPPLPSSPDAGLPLRPIPNPPGFPPSLFLPGTVSVLRAGGPFDIDVILPLIGFVPNQGFLTIDLVLDPENPASISSVSVRSAQLSLTGTPVPEPASGVLMLLALTGLAVARREQADRRGRAALQR